MCSGGNSIDSIALELFMCMHMRIVILMHACMRMCCVCVSIRIYFGLSHCALVLYIVFACLSAMIALLLFGFLVIVSVADATHAYGHMIVFMLPDMSPLWPLRFAIAWTLVSPTLRYGLT